MILFLALTLLSVSVNGLSSTADKWSAVRASKSLTEAVRALDDLKAEGGVRLWRSANAKLQPKFKVSPEILATATRTRDAGDAFGVYGSQQLDKIAALMLGVTFSAAASATAAAEWLTPLPEIGRFVIVQALCFSPYLALTIGIAAPNAVQRTLTALYAQASPAYRARLVRHEAGHVMVGHILGLPLKKISLNAAAAAAQFYDDEPHEEASANFDDRPTLETIAIVSLAGLMAEIIYYAEAEGGAADLLQLQTILDARGIKPDDQQEITRWAALQAFLILKRNAAALETLVARLLQDQALGNNEPDIFAALQALETSTAEQEDDAKLIARLRDENRVEPNLIERILTVKRPRDDLGFDQPVQYLRESEIEKSFSLRKLLPTWSPEDVPTLAFGTTFLFLIYVVQSGFKF